MLYPCGLVSNRGSRSHHIADAVDGDGVIPAAYLVGVAGAGVCARARVGLADNVSRNTAEALQVGRDANKRGESGKGDKSDVVDRCCVVWSG